MQSLDIQKQRHYFANKGRIVKAMVFPAVMCRCESWTIKKAECQRIDAFGLWCWRRKRLENPLDCKEIKPDNPKKNYDKPGQVLIVKAMVFLLVKYGCESWTIKKAEC